MLAAFKKLKEQLTKIFGGMSWKARAALLVVIVGVASTLAYLTMADRTDYAVLFSGLATEDAARITEALRKTRTPFRLEAGGATIMVAADKVHEVRLNLAGQGLPRGGGVGFEIFDTQKFGMSDFAQQVNYRRALQGELERTISQIDAVAAARVHIALPERQIFARESKPVSASVTLRLHPGRTLSRGSVNAIVHLVSSSETGLSPDQITVVDTTGTMLWSGRDGVTGSGGPLDQKRSLEDNYERRVAEILDAAVGPGHSVVKVTADVALSQIEQTDTEYDPDKAAVRSESSLEEKDGSNTQAAAGIPGVQGNLPGGPAPATGAGTTGSQRKTVTRNFEVNKTVRHKVLPPGELRRLSVAVLIDSKALAAANAGAKASGKAAGVELAGLEDVVKQAVGFSGTRGDVVALKSVYFAPEQQLDAPKPSWFKTYVLQDRSTLKSVGTVLGIFLVVWFLARMLRRPAIAEAEVLELPKTVRELEASAVALPAANAVRAALPQAEPQPRDLANAAAEHDAARTATVLKAWLAGE